jgi:hypothetical protein
MDGYCQTFVRIFHKCTQRALNNYIGKREADLLPHQHFTSLPHPFNLQRRTRGIKLYNIIFMLQPWPLFIHFCLILRKNWNHRNYFHNYKYNSLHLSGIRFKMH